MIMRESVKGRRKREGGDIKSQYDHLTIYLFMDRNGVRTENGLFSFFFCSLKIIERELTLLFRHSYLCIQSYII